MIPHQPTGESLEPGRILVTNIRFDRADEGLGEVVWTEHSNWDVVSEECCKLTGTNIKERGNEGG